MLIALRSGNVFAAATGIRTSRRWADKPGSSVMRTGTVCYPRGLEDQSSLAKAHLLEILRKQGHLMKQATLLPSLWKH